MEKEIKAAKKKIKSHLRVNEFQSALDICQELISRDVSLADVFTYQGVCFFRLQQLVPAIASYDSALSIDGEYLDALKGLAQCLLSTDNEVAHPQKQLSTFTKLLQVAPGNRNSEVFRKKIVLCQWKVAEYDLCFQSLSGLSPADAAEILPIMFTEVTKTESSLCFEQLFRILQENEDLMPSSNKMKFYFEYGSYLNSCGKDPSSLVNLMISNLAFYKDKIRVDWSGSSLGSDDTGIEIEPSSEEWWPAQTLAAQLWNLWTHLEHWNGSPKLDISESVLDSLEDTALILRKDSCPAKTVLHVLQDLDCSKIQEVVQLCSEYTNSPTCSSYNRMCSFHDNMCVVHGNGPVMMFLCSVADATRRRNVDTLPKHLKILERILGEKPTYHNTSLLKLVVRLRCYVIYTFSISLTECNVWKEAATQDPVIQAWSALTNGSLDILTCENRDPMTEAVKQFLLGTTPGRHVNLDKILSLREAHPNNFTYNTLLLKVLRKQVDEGAFDVVEYETILNKCYCVDKKNPIILLYLADSYRVMCKDKLHKDYSEAARFYEKSIRLDPNPDVLKLLDSLPQTDDKVKEANIKSHCHVLKVSRDYKLHIRLSMLHEDNPKLAIDHLHQALQISEDPLILELLGEKYLRLGRYGSAYKAFQKANEMDPTPFRQYNLATITLSRYSPAQALAQFQAILESNSCYGPALLGCVKSLYQLTVGCFSSGRYPHAVELANQCVTYIDLVLQFERLSTTWRYLGDICLLLVRLRDSVLVLTSNIRNVLELKEEDVSGESLAHLAVKCYGKGLEIQPTCSEYLVDLTRSYLVVSEYQEGYLLHALTLAKRAVSLRSRDHVAWNMLGNVCIKHKLYKLAQHALVKSLQLCKDDNPEAWTNLGLLYMLNKEYELANKCYGEAQSNDLTYAPCWVAQAYLAGLLGYSEECGKIFKDLIRDVTRQMTVEGTLGFALQFTSKSEMSHDLVHKVLTLTARCTHFRHSADWLLFNITGVLYEHLKLYKQAHQHNLKAHTLSPTPEIREKLQYNIDRVQYKLGNYSAMSQNHHSLWLPLARMKQAQYGMASSILDNMSGQDVSVFQAVLCWLSRDKVSAPSFLQHTDSDMAELLKCLILSEHPSKSLQESIDIKPLEVQTKFTCLVLQLQGTSERDTIPLSVDCLYLLAKHLIVHKRELGKARQVLDLLIKEGAFKEDLYELYVESSDGEDSDEEMRGYILRSCHMFPWRDNSNLLLSSLKSCLFDK